MTSEKCLAKAREMDALAVKFPKLSAEYAKLARTFRTAANALALDEEQSSSLTDRAAPAEYPTDSIHQLGFAYVSTMEHDKTRYSVTNDATGKTEARQLVDEKALHFCVLMAIRDCCAFSGTPKLGRDSNRRAIADSVVKHFRESGYRVMESVPWNGPIGNGKHLWKKDGED